MAPPGPAGVDQGLREPEFKLTAAWGERQAQELWDNFLAKYPIDWAGATVLDFGCLWGHLGMFLIDRVGVPEVHGVDIKPAWDWMVDGTRPQAVEGLHLHVGDLPSIPQLASQRFDVVISAGTFPLIEPTKLHEIMRWFYAHLEPGGHCAIDTRTYFSELGAELQDKIATPLPHLLFPKRIIAEHLSRLDMSHPYTNSLCGATHLMLYRRVGFDVVQVERLFTEPDSPAWSRFPDKLGMYAPAELRTARLQTLLRKPASPADGSALARALDGEA